MNIARAMALAALVVVAPTAAWAQNSDAERQACLDAAVRGQELLKGRHLASARTLLVQCASEACPGLVRRDCARWLDETQAAQSSVVLVARDAQGHDVVDARVLVDGEVVADALTGKAFDIDPGEHVLRVERASKPPFEQKVPVREGEKRQVFTLQVEPVATVVIEKPHEVVVRERASVPAVTWVFMTAGLVSGALFGGFAIKGTLDRTALGCDTGCLQPQRTQVETEFDVADVALGVGVVALGVALATFLARGYVTKRSSALVLLPHAHGTEAAWQWSF